MKLQEWKDPFDGPTPDLDQFNQHDSSTLPISRSSSPFYSAAAAAPAGALTRSPSSATVPRLSPPPVAVLADKDADAHIKIKAGPPCTDGMVIAQNPEVRQLLLPLKALRVLQILCTSIFLLLCIIVLASRQGVSSAVAAEVQASRLARHYRQRADPEEAFLMDDAVAQTMMIMLVVFTSVCFIIAVASLALSVVWLVFTVSPGKRPRRYNSGRTHCSRFTCDLVWDTAFCCLWAAAVLLSCLSVGIYAGTSGVGVAVGQICLAAVVLVLHVVSAVVSGLVRRRVQRAAASERSVFGVQMGVGGVYPQVVCRTGSPVDELNSTELL